MAAKKVEQLEAVQRRAVQYTADKEGQLKQMEAKANTIASGKVVSKTAPLATKPN